MIIITFEHFEMQFAVFSGGFFVLELFNCLITCAGGHGIFGFWFFYEWPTTPKKISPIQLNFALLR